MTILLQGQRVCLGTTGEGQERYITKGHEESLGIEDVYCLEFGDVGLGTANLYTLNMCGLWPTRYTLKSC